MTEFDAIDRLLAMPVVPDAVQRALAAVSGDTTNHANVKNLAIAARHAREGGSDTRGSAMRDTGACGYEMWLAGVGGCRSTDGRKGEQATCRPHVSTAGHGRLGGIRRCEATDAGAAAIKPVPTPAFDGSTTCADAVVALRNVERNQHVVPTATTESASFDGFCEELERHGTEPLHRHLDGNVVELVLQDISGWKGGEPRVCDWFSRFQKVREQTADAVSQNPLDCGGRFNAVFSALSLEVLQSATLPRDGRDVPAFRADTTLFKALRKHFGNSGHRRLVPPHHPVDAAR